MALKRCKHESCNGVMNLEYDRAKCLICGRSEWADFGIRKPYQSEIKGSGCPVGTRANGKDKIKARI